MVSFPLIRIYSSVTYPDMLPPHKVRLNKKSTTLRLTMIFKQPLRKETWFFLVSFLILAAQFTVFRIYEPDGVYSLHSRIFLSVADAAVICLPWFLVPPRWRVSILLPMLGVPLYLLVNLLYARNFNGLLPISQIFSGASYNRIVFRSGIASLQMSDILFGLLTILYVGIFLIFRPWRFRIQYPWRMKIAGCATVTVLFIAQTVFMHYAALTWHKIIPGNYSLERHIEVVRLKFTDGNRTQRLAFTGWPLYFVLEIWQVIRPVDGLTHDERREVDRFLKSQSSPLSLLCKIEDNRRKNLIVIVVESLDAQIVGLCDSSGKPLFPFINSLAHTPGSLKFSRMRPLVGEGRSSDGNLIYTTGLLPIPGTSVANFYADQDFPSLPRALSDHHAVEILAEGPGIWNHGRTNVAYGYSGMYPHAGEDRIPGERVDSACFANALDILSTLPQPFMAQIFTLEMHSPFIHSCEALSPLPRLSGLSKEEYVYLKRVALFEEGLRLFFAGLEKNGLIDKSVIVIVSDHNTCGNDTHGDFLTDPSCFLLILNSGVSPAVSSDSVEISQADVYPTILDIFGSRYRWRGFGRSLLRDPRLFHSDGIKTGSDTLPPDYPSADAWRLSRRMIQTHTLPTP